jgi:NADH:ubiquinone oxidoreductase subunit H
MSELALILSLTTVLLALFVVLVERKFLAYAQRRMGPAVMGRNGALQIALDLVKESPFNFTILASNIEIGDLIGH